MSKLPDQELADIGIFTDEYQRARTARLLNERPHTKPAPVAAPCADDPCHHCGKQLHYSRTVTPQFPDGGMALEERPVYRCEEGHEFERLERRS